MPMAQFSQVRHAPLKADVEETIIMPRCDLPDGVRQMARFTATGVSVR